MTAPLPSRRVEHAHRYQRALEEFATGERLAAFFAADVTQIEYPNRLVPAGATRGLADLLQGAERGRQVLRAQEYRVRQAYECGDTVILEVEWSGTLAVAVGTLGAGDVMRAHFALFLQYGAGEDGPIRAQRNYDCFAPF